MSATTLTPERAAAFRQQYLDYRATLPPEGLSLKALLKIMVDSEDFQPNRHAAEAEVIVKQWCQDKGILLSNIDEYLTMAAYAHPNASLEWLINQGKVYAFLYYLDDTVANDTARAHATGEQSFDFGATLARCMEAFKTGDFSFEQTQLEKILIDLMKLFAAEDPVWALSFAKTMGSHLELATKNQDTVAVGQAYTLGTYTEARRHVSGMIAMDELTQIAQGYQTMWRELDNSYIKVLLDQLRLYCQDIGGLANDVVSVKKELELGTDFNLVAVMWAFNKEGSFGDAIVAACDHINRLYDSFLNTHAELKRVVRERKVEPALRADIEGYANELKNIVLATGRWQLTTPRYQSPDSPYTETTTSLPAAVA